MTPLPPLGLVDETLIMDNSMIELFQYCPRAFLHSALYKRVTAHASPGRNFGSACHVGWKERYTRCGTRKPTEQDEAFIHAAMERYFTENPPPEGDFRNLEHAYRVLDTYNRYYQDEPFTLLSTGDKPIVESSFMLDIGMVQNVKIKYCGRLDLGMRDSTGLWVYDHKTAFQFGQQFEAEMAMDTGQLGYTWAFNEIFKQRPVGYVTNAIRIRKPKKSDEYAEVPPVDKSDFKRIPTVVSPSMLAEFQDNVLRWAGTILWYYDQGVFPRVSGKKGCVGKYGLCEYYDVCSVVPESRQHVLQGPGYQDNKWTPYNKGKEE